MILGITGKIGVGKTTAAQFFEQRGWVVLEADHLAHELYRPYRRAWKQLVDRFGEGILKKNDVIDRQKLKLLVFGNSPESKKALEDLNQILHPELRRTLKDEVYYLQKRHKNAVIVAALWKEVELFELCDKVLLIQSGDALAYERLHKREGLDFDLFESLNATQQDPEHADFIVQNEGDFQALYKELNQIINQL